MTGDIHLKIKSSPCQIKHIESFVQSLMCQCHITNEIYDNILISLTEAVNNAIIHGNKADIRKYVNIKCKEKTQKIIIRISDEGSGFDPGNVKDPTLPENLEECGGRGVFIMRELSDKIVFS